MSLTKDGIKDRFERDNPPTESEFQTEEYMEHRRKVDSTYPQFIHGIPGDVVLRVHWEETYPPTEGIPRSCGKPTSSGALSRSCILN